MWRKRRLMSQTTSTEEFQIPMAEEAGVAGVKATTLQRIMRTLVDKATSAVVEERDWNQGSLAEENGNPNGQQ
jgi:hypothetical protein